MPLCSELVSAAVRQIDLAAEATDPTASTRCFGSGRRAVVGHVDEVLQEHSASIFMVQVQKEHNIFNLCPLHSSYYPKTRLKPLTSSGLG